MSSHTTDALVLTCMDFRLHQADPAQLADFLKSLGLKTWDLRTQQGIAKDLLASVVGSHKQSLLDAIGIAKKLHGAKKVLIMNHEDCGGYGGRKAFADAAAEHAKHEKDLREARQEVKNVYPDLQVQLWYIGIKETATGPQLSFTEIP